jgi:hypothetical protein
MVVPSGLASALAAAAYISVTLAHPDRKDPVILRRALDTQAFHTEHSRRARDLRNLWSPRKQLLSAEQPLHSACARNAVSQILFPSPPRLISTQLTDPAPIRHRRDLTDVEKWEGVIGDVHADATWWLADRNACDQERRQLISPGGGDGGC